jgi:aryl-alcohol dehydrogenase-like predicted oxidoreductase
MGELIAAGKIRGWGLCNDNAFGLTACCEVRDVIMTSS